MSNDTHAANTASTAYSPPTTSPMIPPRTPAPRYTTRIRPTETTPNASAFHLKPFVKSQERRSASPDEPDSRAGRFRGDGVAAGHDDPGDDERQRGQDRQQPAHEVRAEDRSELAAREPH